MSSPRVPRSKTFGTGLMRWIASLRPWMTPLGEVDARLLELLENPTERARKLSEELFARASKCADEIEQSGVEIPHVNFDQVIGGGGFLCLHFCGVHSILRELERRGRVQLGRYSGASSGSQTPFKILLSGSDEECLHIYIAYGELQEEFCGIGPITTDYQFRWLIEWMMNQKRRYGVEREEEFLQRLRDRMFTSITKLPTFSNILESEYISRKLLIEAYVGTGTFISKFKGNFVVDGGASKNKPLFQDELRAQLIVDVTKAKLPNKLLHLMKYDLTFLESAMKRGQDDVTKFFLEGKHECFRWKQTSKTY